jgi:DNA-binding transcriptional MerR regulator
MNMSKSSYQGSENIEKNLGDNLPRVKQVAAMLGETEDVIRNWLKELKAYIPVTKAGNGYQLFTDDAIDVLRMIQRMNRNQGYTIRQIEGQLAAGKQEPITEQPAADPGTDVLKKLTEIEQMLQLQSEFNKELLTRLDNQQQYIEQSLKTRDQNLVESLREIRENRLAIAAAEEDKKPWWKWW